MNPEVNETYLIKTSNPVTGTIMTYKTSKKTILVGSDSSCELIVSLPSIAPVHLIVNFFEKKIKAVGNDVRVDYTAISSDNFASFNNNSLISIHNIFFMFLSIDERSDILAEAKEAENKLVSACSKYAQYSPYLKIIPSTQDISLAPEYDRNIQTNRQGLASLYKKEMGEFSEMPPLTHMEAQDTANPVIKRVEEQFEQKYDSMPNSKTIAAVIDSEISDVKDNIQKAIDGITDIKVVKEEIPDLGRSAIQNEILNEALKEVETKEDKSIPSPIEDQNKILEAELKSMDDLRNSITDKIKEEFRSAISDMVQEETKEYVGKEVERCFQEPKFTQFVSETVAEQSKAVIEEFKSQIEDLKEVQEKIIEATAPGLSSEIKEDNEVPGIAREKANDEHDVKADLKENEDKGKHMKKSENKEPVESDARKTKSAKNPVTSKITKESKKKDEEQETVEEQPAKKPKKAQVTLQKSKTETKKAEDIEKLKTSKSKESKPAAKEVETPKGRVSERKQAKKAMKDVEKHPKDADTLSKSKDNKKTIKTDTKKKVTTSKTSKKK